MQCIGLTLKSVIFLFRLFSTMELGGIISTGHYYILSSPRAGAVTVSQCLTLGWVTLTETAVTRKSRKIDPKVPNRPPSRGLQTGHRRNPGSYSKKWTFGPKTENFGQKKMLHFLPLTMFRPRPGNVVQRKKYPFPK